MSEESAMFDPRVVAIRADNVVGRGSCSHWDECYSDDELVAAFPPTVKTAFGAVRWARYADRVLHDVYDDRMQS